MYCYCLIFLRTISFGSISTYNSSAQSLSQQRAIRLINSMFKQSFDCYCKFQRNSDNDMSIQIYQKRLKIYGYAICTLKLIKTHLFTLSRVITDTILITSKDLNAMFKNYIFWIYFYVQFFRSISFSTTCNLQP
jgi:hypothetical protein